ncbi:MAG: formyltransferase family protein [Coriobacteriia bacterium]
MKMAFATCVQLGLSCIEEVYRIGGEFALLITLKDEKGKSSSGRVYLDDVSDRHGVPLIKVDNINDVEVIRALGRYEIDWLFIIGWSQIAKSEILAAPARGCIGMHPTLLPVGRGRAAIPWAIIKGLSQTGVTLFKLDEGVDTGDIIGQGVIEIGENTTATSLYKQVEEMHKSLISKYWSEIVSDQLTLTKQDEARASEWPARRPQDGRLLSTMTMEEADRLVRAVTHPYPGAFYVDGDRTLRIWSAKADSDQGEIRLSDGFLAPVDYEIDGQ